MQFIRKVLPLVVCSDNNLPEHFEYRALGFCFPSVSFSFSGLAYSFHLRTHCIGHSLMDYIPVRGPYCKLQILVFSPSIYRPSPKRGGHKLKRKKRGSVNYSTNQEEGVSKVIIATLLSDTFGNDFSSRKAFEFLTYVERKTSQSNCKDFCASLGPGGKGRSLQGLLESPKKNGDNSAFFEILVIISFEPQQKC